MYAISELFDLSHSAAGDYLAQFQYPWQAFSGIRELILTLGPRLGPEYRELSPTVWVHETAKIAPTAYLGAPCIIGANTEVRHCAFVRGSALVGESSRYSGPSRGPRVRISSLIPAKACQGYWNWAR